ncbi:MAG: FIST C-terminal domain-containing protein [Desulfovibrio sp.]|jgi:hypothetical protein|nr:FIST C-terminal domain-containing protein [Desulfovibrio sp.]
MKSAVATTFELDDAAQAVSELTEAVREKLVPDKNSIGILLCDADLDGAAVTQGLRETLGIEIAGMTTLAPFNADGRQESAATLTVLTAADCGFIPTLSPPLAVAGDYAQKISSTCRQALAAGADYGDKPVFAIVFCPNGRHFSGDAYPAAFAEAMPGVPIIGGTCSDDYDQKRARIFLSGRETRDAMLTIGVWGNVRPTFAVRHVTSRFAEHLRRVTEARDNVVYKVGDKTFIQYLEEFGLKTDVSDPVIAFTPHPMMLIRDNSDETPLMRHIAGLDLAAGSGTFFGDVPVGAMANICLINKYDLETSCRESMKTLLDRAHDEKENLSTILCFSCCGRAMLISGDPNAEGRVISEMLPDNLSVSGAYCLGELSPTSFTDGNAVNRFHNCSITFCIF